MTTGRGGRKSKPATGKPDGLELSRLTSTRAVNECVEQFHVFSRGCTDVGTLRSVFTHYCDTILQSLRLRRNNKGDVLEADILLINAAWQLELSSATHQLYWRYVPELEVRRDSSGKLTEPKAGDGLAVYAIWMSGQNRAGVVCCRSPRSAAA